MTSEQIIERGRQVLRLEREALATVEDRIGESFADAVLLLAECSGRVIVTGVGKSGLIGRKIAATLTSTASAPRSSSGSAVSRSRPPARSSS